METQIDIGFAMFIVTELTKNLPWQYIKVVKSIIQYFKIIKMVNIIYNEKERGD